MWLATAKLQVNDEGGVYAGCFWIWGTDEYSEYETRKIWTALIFAPRKWGGEVCVDDTTNIGRC